MPAWTERDWDHERDTRKHDFPLRLERQIPTALDCAALVKMVSLEQGAELIEQFARDLASQQRLDAVAAGARP